ncbi:sigma-70 family RNA polymerase sigma factor [Parasphingorhabdus litoris]|uniref:Sigma-70 family RNA polymerase sigma factor n=1 Tax=Parasphingorhabdus litoris TaxID=394733 RepID=A0ABP3KM70_9SPHN|nr:sigma-70 family RNA polymerase sigma factor [Parasphingorhabdus litoris]
MAQTNETDRARAQLSGLIGQAANGDRLAFQDIYNLTSAKLFGVCLRILNDRQASEDALQDAYVKIWRNAARFDAQRASPITWLATIARNTAIDRKRSGGNRVMVSDDAITNMAAKEQNILERLEAQEGTEILNKCLDSLEARQRNVIRTAFFEGHSYNELAQKLGTPLGTVKSWVRRGLKRLKDCIDDG